MMGHDGCRSYLTSAHMPHIVPAPLMKGDVYRAEAIAEDAVEIMILRPPPNAVADCRA